MALDPASRTFLVQKDLYAVFGLLALLYIEDRKVLINSGVECVGNCVLECVGSLMRPFLRSFRRRLVEHLYINEGVEDVVVV